MPLIRLIHSLSNSILCSDVRPFFLDNNCRRKESERETERDRERQGEAERDRERQADIDRERKEGERRET